MFMGMGILEILGNITRSSNSDFGDVEADDR